MPVLPNQMHEVFAQELAKGATQLEAYKRAGYADCRSAACRLSTNVNVRARIVELEANGPPPYDSVSKAMVHTKWANRYEPGQLSNVDLISVVLFDSDASLKDLRDYMNGITTSQDHFRDAVEREDIRSLGTTFAIPFFVFQGAIDNVTPVAPVREYVDSITAPRKDLVLIPNAGHNAIATRSDEFLKLLIQRVRPLALESP